MMNASSPARPQVVDFSPAVRHWGLVAVYEILADAATNSGWYYTDHGYLRHGGFPRFGAAFDRTRTVLFFAGPTAPGREDLSRVAASLFGFARPPERMDIAPLAVRIPLGVEGVEARDRERAATLASAIIEEGTHSAPPFEVRLVSNGATSRWGANEPTFAADAILVPLRAPGGGERKALFPLDALAMWRGLDARRTGERLTEVTDALLLQVACWVRQLPRFDCDFSMGRDWTWHAWSARSTRPTPRYVWRIPTANGVETISLPAQVPVRGRSASGQETTA